MAVRLWIRRDPVQLTVMHRQSGRLNIKYIESAVLPLDSPNRSAGSLYIIYARLPGAPHHRRSPGGLRHPFGGTVPESNRLRVCSIGSDYVSSLFLGTAGYFHAWFICGVSNRWFIIQAGSNKDRKSARAPFWYHASIRLHRFSRSRY